MSDASGRVLYAGEPTGDGLRAAENWPSPEGIIDRLVAALEAAAEDELREPEERICSRRPRSRWAAQPTATSSWITADVHELARHQRATRHPPSRRRSPAADNVAICRCRPAPRDRSHASAAPAWPTPHMALDTRAQYRAQPPGPAPALTQFVAATHGRLLSSVIEDAVPQHICERRHDQSSLSMNHCRLFHQMNRDPLVGPEWTPADRRALVARA
jgi:hypothetical protein